MVGNPLPTSSRDPDMPITDVQWVLGHASLTTTQIYVLIGNCISRVRNRRSAGHRIAGTAFRPSWFQPCDLGTPGADPI